LKFGQQLYWIYTEGKSLIMKLDPASCVIRLVLIHCLHEMSHESVINSNEPK